MDKKLQSPDKKTDKKELEKSKKDIPESTTIEPEDTHTSPEKDSVPSTPRNLVPYVLGGVAVIGVLLLLTGASVVLAATNLGQNNAFSRLSQIIPVEQLSFLDKVRRPNAALVADAINFELQENKIQILGGQETAADMKFSLDLENTVNSSKIALSGKIKATQAYNATGDQSTGTVTMGGAFRSGIIAVDTEDEGIKVDYISESKEKGYFKYQLSDSVRDSLKPVLLATGFDISEEEGKYFFVNPFEYRAMMQEQQKLELEALGIDPAEAGLSVTSSQVTEEATDELLATLQPDLEALFKKTLTNLGERSTFSTMPRTTVAGRQVIPISISTDESALVDVTKSLVTDAKELVMRNKAAFITYCEKTTVQPAASTAKRKTAPTPTCEQQWSELEKELVENTDTTDATSLTQAINGKGMIERLVVYVDPVDASLVKLDLAVVLSFTDTEAQKTDLQSAFTSFDEGKIGFELTYSEVSRGQSKEIVIPSDAMDLTAKVKERFESERSKNAAEYAEFRRYLGR